MYCRFSRALAYVLTTKADMFCAGIDRNLIYEGNYNTKEKKKSS